MNAYMNFLENMNAAIRYAQTLAEAEENTDPAKSSEKSDKEADEETGNTDTNETCA